jgi:hypothetical protein
MARTLLAVLASTLIALLAACASPVAVEQSHSPAASATLLPTASPTQVSTPHETASPSPSPEPSIPATVTVTFRLTLRGPVPDDAVFAIQDGDADGAQHAIYLCSYYGGWPVCARGESYEDVWTGLPGTRLTYDFWRELDMDGTQEQMNQGELTVGPNDQVVSVTYSF